MTANQLVMRVAGLKSHAMVFWSLQLMNVLIGTCVIVFGLPGFEQLPVVRWFIGLLFFFRTVVNNNHRLEWLKELKDGAEDQKEAHREALLGALKKAEAEDGATS